jgi:protein-S-isoprenylcysteine O-methyltransferase Ste14
VAPVLGSFAIFAVIALLVVNAADGEQDAPALITIGLFAAYVLHADSVLTSAYIDVGRVGVPKEPFLALGLLIMAAGTVLFLWATRTLVAHGAFRGLSTTQLVAAGPYAWMRHPQDVGWGIVLLGVAVAGRTLVGLALMVVFAVFVSRLWRADDRQLEQRFGQGFRDYRARTPVAPALRPRPAS